jgi:hypothetical protein
MYLFFLFTEEKTYLITCTSEILPLFFLQGRKKIKQTFEKENDIPPPFVLSLSRSVWANQNEEKHKNKKVAIVFFLLSKKNPTRRISSDCVDYNSDYSSSVLLKNLVHHLNNTWIIFPNK